MIAEDLVANDFGAYLKRHLHTSGVRTQMALAQAVEMDYGQLNKIFTGKTQRPEIETLKKLAPALRRPLAEMMRAAGYPEASDEAASSSAEDFQMNLEIPEDALDSATIVAYVESRPGKVFQDRLRQQRDRMRREDYVRFCLGLFRSWSSNSELALTSVELRETDG